MSFFPRNFITHEPAGFHPLFRLLDDFDSYTRSGNAGGHHRGSTITKSFTPKFDVKELGDTYELHGELAGVDQKDIEIEFSDSQTLNVRGRTNHSYTSGTPPAGLTSGKTTEAIADTEASLQDTSHQATVEDEDATATAASTADSAPASESQLAKPVSPATTQPAGETRGKYWVSERSVGEFSRSFTFPVRIDAENVEASMRNGVLSIVVPKAKKYQARKIPISASL